MNHHLNIFDLIVLTWISTGETVNNFLNENSQEVFAEVKPEVSKQVQHLVIKVMNDALSALPTEKFLKSNRRRT